MAIDGQLRRGSRAGPAVDPRKILSLALLAMTQWITGSASAQIAGPTSTGVPPASTGVESPGNGGIARNTWRFVPSIGLDETYSDNINLTSAGSRRSDFVTTVSPALRATRYGSRLTATFDYEPQLLYYSRGTNGFQTRNYLDARADAAIIENFLFFNALASISQGVVSPFGTLAADSVNGSANRAETRTYSLGPSLRSHFGNDLSYSAGYQFTGSTANNSAYAANHTSVLYGQVQSGTSFRDLGIGLDASRNRQSYGNAGEIVQETAGTTLTYVVVPTCHLRGRIGYDRNSYPTTGQPDLKGVAYSAGFDWQPSHHTQLNVQVGHRYFGPTANISLSQTSHRFSISASYVRDQTTSSGSGLGLVANPNYALVDQFYRTTITDAALRAQAVNAALSQAGLSTSEFATSSFLSNQLYLQKLAQISIVLFGLRNTVTLQASRNDSQSLSNIDTGFDVFNQAQRFRSTQFSVNWSHRVGPRTSANVTASKIHNQAVEGVGDTRQRVLTASINRQFGHNLTGTAMVRNTQQSGASQDNGFNTRNGNFYGGNYRENAVLGSLRLTF